MSLRARRVAAMVVAAAAGLALAAPARAAVPVPAGMDALGDSITRAVNSCSFNDCPVGSWATGTRADVNSIARRLTAWRPDFTAYNDAKSGAEMDDLVRQANLAVGRDVDFVTLLLGANDACNPTVASMTTVAQYRKELDAGLKVIRTGLPDARLFVLSVPDVYQLWSIGKDQAAARNIWDAAQICQSILKNPQSDAPADVTRRQTVLQRVKDYNAQLQQACAALNDAAFPDRCTYDGGQVFDTKFSLDMVSKVDYFHPSIAGQGALAEGAWTHGIEFQDPNPPRTEDRPVVVPDAPPSPLSAAPAVVSAASSRPPARTLSASGGGRTGKRLSTLWLGPADAPLRAFDVRLGAGAKLRVPRGGRVGTATLVSSSWQVLRRVPLRASALRGGVLHLEGLPAQAAGARIELASDALALSGGCRVPGWSADVVDTAGARSVVRAARRC